MNFIANLTNCKIRDVSHVNLNVWYDDSLRWTLLVIRQVRSMFLLKA